MSEHTFIYAQLNASLAQHIIRGNRHVEFTDVRKRFMQNEKVQLDLLTPLSAISAVRRAATQKFRLAISIPEIRSRSRLACAGSHLPAAVW